MADEFKHLTAGTSLTQGEYEAVGGHVFACQAIGDIVYASSSSQLLRLEKGAANTVLAMGGSCIPAWTNSPSLNALAVDDVNIDGKVVTLTGSACDTIVMTAAANGAFSLVTTDTAAAAANIQITADGTVDIDSAGVLTLDSGAAINIEPAACSAILLDGTISIDAGVVTGATSVTSTHYVTGNNGTVKFLDGDGNKYFTLAAHACTTACIAYTFPPAGGSCGNVLTTNGSGVLSWAAAGGQTINNATANELVTIGATTTELCAEANLTFDGTLLTLVNASCRQILAPSGAVGKPGIAFAADVDNGFYLPSCNNIRAVTNGIDMFNIHEGNGGFNIEFGDTANTDGDRQMTLNQGCKSNAIFALKSACTHGVTGLMEADTFFTISRAHTGGVKFQTAGQDDIVHGYLFMGGGSSNCADKNASANSPFQIQVGTSRSGTGLTNSANDNLFTVRCYVNGEAQFIVDVEGDFFYDGSGTAFDEHCDVGLVRAFSTSMALANCKPCVIIHSKWDDYVKDNEQTLVELGVLGDYVNCVPRSKKGLVNGAQLQRLHNGAIWQLHTNLMETREELDTLKGQMKALEAGK